MFQSSGSDNARESYPRDSNPPPVVYNHGPRIIELPVVGNDELERSYQLQMSPRLHVEGERVCSHM